MKPCCRNCLWRHGKHTAKMGAHRVVEYRCDKFGADMGPLQRWNRQRAWCPLHEFAVTEDDWKAARAALAKAGAR